MRTTFFLFLLTIFLVPQSNAQDLSLQELINRRQYAQVVVRADSLIAADSTDRVSLYALGQAYEGLLKYRDAYRIYEQCFRLDTTNIDLMNTLARTATNLGRATEAEHYFNKVLANDTTNFYANYQLGRLYQQLGDYDKAIEQYNYLLEQDPNNASLLRTLGDVFSRMELYMGAAGYYLYAFNQNKENAGLASSLVNTMLRTGDKDMVAEALAVCDTALLYSPSNLQLKRNKGMALFMNKKYAPADTIYSALMAEGDSIYATIKYAGASKYYAGQYMDAIEHLERAFDMDTSAVDVNILLGSSLGRTYDRRQAYVFFDRAEHLMLPSATLTNLLLQSRAETLIRDSRLKEATSVYYELWKRTERMDILQTLTAYHSALNIADYKSSDEKQRALFLRVLRLRTLLDAKEDIKKMYHERLFFESLYEDMFFRSVTEEPMRSPDGQRSSISLIDVRYLMNQLPEVTDEIRERWFKAQENSKKSQRDYLGGLEAAKVEVNSSDSVPEN